MRTTGNGVCVRTHPSHSDWSHFAPAGRAWEIRVSLVPWDYYDDDYNGDSTVTRIHLSRMTRTERALHRERPDLSRGRSRRQAAVQAPARCPGLTTSRSTPPHYSECLGKRCWRWYLSCADGSLNTLSSANWVSEAMPSIFKVPALPFLQRSKRRLRSDYSHAAPFKMY